MTNPKYGRRKVRIDPRLSVQPGIVDVEIDDDKTVSAPAPTATNNGYSGGVTRDDRPTQIIPTDTAPVTSGTNPWGIAKLKDQTLVINSNGDLVVEVTFELPDWTGGYESRAVIV